MTPLRRTAAAAVILLVAVPAAVGLWLWLRPAPPIRLEPENAALVAEGRQVYETSCARCHGAKMEGQPDWRTRLPNGRLPAPPHDASGHTWHHGDALLFRITKDGMAAVAPPDYPSDMPAFRGVLSDHQIIAALSYVKSTWPAEIRHRQDALNRQEQR